MRGVLGLVAVAGLACAGGEGDCGPITRASNDLTVTVTPENGCMGATWRADVAFPDGRTQVLAGDRNGVVVVVLIGDFSGDSLADLVVEVEPRRLFGFTRQGGILFGRELPSPPGPGEIAIVEGKLTVGPAAWDPALGVWARPD